MKFFKLKNPNYDASYTIRHLQHTSHIRLFDHESRKMEQRERQKTRQNNRNRSLAVPLSSVKKQLNNVLFEDFKNSIACYL